MLGYEFECLPVNVDETIEKGVSPEQVVRQLALKKAKAALDLHGSGVTIGSDTVVALGDKILGKPKNKNEAAEMLRLLSGNIHTVYTGVAIMSKKLKDVFSAATQVEFFKLTEKEIVEYIATGEPMDKAGAYGIQGRGTVLIKSIKGDFFTVMGLPAALVARHLRDFDINL